MKQDRPDKLIRLPEVPKLAWLPSRPDGRPIHVQSVYNWTLRGVRGVKLRSLQVGGMRCTTEPWLIEFFERISMPVTTPTAVTPTQARKAHEAAKARLAAHGIECGGES